MDPSSSLAGRTCPRPRARGRAGLGLAAVLLAVLAAGGGRAHAAGSTAITLPPTGSVFAAGQTFTFAWTAVPGAALYGFEFTGTSRAFANPNGTAPDPVNGFGGAGGGFLVNGTSVTVELARGTPPGSYQIRVIGLTADRLLGQFSDAVTVVVTPPPTAFWAPSEFVGNEPLVVAAVGDSITEGVLGDPPYPVAARPYPAVLQDRLRSAFSGVPVVVKNRGRGGETTDGGLDRLPSVLTEDRPAVVLIMEGTNDATFGRSVGSVLGNLRAMVQRVKESGAIPVLGTIVPNFRDAPEAVGIIDDVNAGLPGLAAEEEVRLIDTHAALDDGGLFGSDRLHPTQQGYEVLGGAWVPGAAAALQDAQSVVGGVWVAGGPRAGASTENHLVLGRGPGGPPEVRVIRRQAPGFDRTFIAYDPGFRGGVRVASCDLDGDGRAEIVTGAGPGGGPHVKAFKLSADGTVVTEVANFLAFDPGLEGGVFVACGKLDGARAPAIVVGAGRGGGAHVRAFRYQSGVPGGVVDLGVSFLAHELAFTGGVSVAVGDLDGDGHGEIITGAGPGAGAEVRGFRYAPAAPGGVVATGLDFLAFTPGFTGGVFVATGDVAGQGRAQLLLGAGPGSEPRMRVIATDPGGLPSGELASVLPYGSAFRGGMAVGVSGTEALTGAGPGGSAHVRGFTSAGAATSTSFLAY